MVENAANFTNTLQGVPSIFEVVAQKSLNDTLHPAFRRLALFLFTSNPAKFRWLERNYEETFLLLNSLLQYHYLKNYDASFAENFYGLKRVLLNNDKLTDSQRKLSFLYLVLLPYFKQKLDEKVTDYKLEKAEGFLKNDFKGLLKKFLILTHTTFEVTWRTLTFITYLKYLANNNESQLLPLNLLQLKLVYSSEMQEVPGFWSNFFRGNLTLSELSFGLVKNAVTSTLDVTAFFLQFLQTWNSERSNYSITALPNVQPPPLDNKSKTFKGRCPICLRPWSNATVLQVSGYIFCFSCLIKYVGEHRKCPVTNLPAKPLNIVKLFIND